MALTKTDKIALVKSLAPQHKTKLRKHLRAHLQAGQGMSGAGLFSFLGSIGKTLLPIVKTVGLPILKEVLLPMGVNILKKKMGAGLSLPGGALRLAGQRGRGRKKKYY
tara:strand:+ start:155 stop:478 length:324 start_codon:yes stop_codon:yes gene_type:complete